MPFVTGLEQMLMEKDLQQGERTGLLAGLELTLEAKFDKEGKEFFANLKTIPELSRLQAVRDAIRGGATIDELRKLL